MAVRRKSLGSGEFTQFNQQNVVELATRALDQTLMTRVRLPLKITFATPLLMQRWTTKAVRKMLGKMVGMPEPRESKDLTQDYEESWYRNMDGLPVVPCRVLKAALVEGAISTGKAVTKAELNRGMRVLGYTSPLILPKDQDKKMDVKIVRNAGGQPDVRARALFPVGTWFEVVIEFGLPLTPDKIMAAAVAAGRTIGLCEWRPAKGGDLGTFEFKVEDAKNIDRIMEQCSIPEDEFVLPPEMLRAFKAIPMEHLNDSQKKVRSLAEYHESQEAPASGRRRRTARPAAESEEAEAGELPTRDELQARINQFLSRNGGEEEAPAPAPRRARTTRANAGNGRRKTRAEA